MWGDDSFVLEKKKKKKKKFILSEAMDM